MAKARKIVGTLMHSIYTNQDDYHIMAFLVEGAKKTEAIVFKDDVSDIPDWGTGEVMEITGHMVASPKYGKQMEAYKWKSYESGDETEDEDPIDDDNLIPVEYCPHCGGEL